MTNSSCNHPHMAQAAHFRGPWSSQRSLQFENLNPELNQESAVSESALDQWLTGQFLQDTNPKVETAAFLCQKKLETWLQGSSSNPVYTAACPSPCSSHCCKAPRAASLRTKCALQACTTLHIRVLHVYL